MSIGCIIVWTQEEGWEERPPSEEGVESTAVKIRAGIWLLR